MIPLIELEPNIENILWLLGLILTEAQRQTRAVRGRKC